MLQKWKANVKGGENQKLGLQLETLVMSGLWLLIDRENLIKFTLQHPTTFTFAPGTWSRVFVATGPSVLQPTRRRS